MDGLDSAKCQNLRLWDISGILEIVNDNKDKIGNSGLLLQKKIPNVQKRRNELQRLGFFLIFLEREGVTSL